MNFAYANEEVLHDLSLTIPEKKIVGITGRSGSGKSTFLRLLMRFWDVSLSLIHIFVAVQKFAKKLLANYWGEYTTLGDSFLENIQGLTTLKIYQADGWKHEQMNAQAERFRKITMKVLTMQLNSVSLMDLMAYGCLLYTSWGCCAT